MFLLSNIMNGLLARILWSDGISKFQRILSHFLGQILICIYTICQLDQILTFRYLWKAIIPMPCITFCFLLCNKAIPLCYQLNHTPLYYQIFALTLSFERKSRGLRARVLPRSKQIRTVVTLLFYSRKIL